MNRRTRLQSLAVVPAVVQGMTRRSQADAALRIAALEASHGGRPGVATLDFASSRRLTHRADERFPMCSTFPAALAGKLPLDAIQTLLPKALSEDCLFVHELPNIPSGDSRGLQSHFSRHHTIDTQFGFAGSVTSL
jgi:hypothetical protein